MKKNVSQKSDSKHVVDGMPALYQESTDKTTIIIYMRLTLMYEKNYNPNHVPDMTMKIHIVLMGTSCFSYKASFNFPNTITSVPK